MTDSGITAEGAVARTGAAEAAALPAGLPMAVPLDGLPREVRIHEVGARDGLQNEKATLPTGVKAEFIHRLAAAGLGTIEATSFVHPKWVPQLADAGELMPLLADLADREPGLRLPVLVPNERGLERALELGVREIAVFGSATESFARANLNRTVDESLAMFEPVVAKARAAGVRVRGYLSMCFGDPWEGPVPVRQVAGVARRLYEMGCTEVSLGDTIGVATPGHVTVLLDELTGGAPATVPATGSGRGSPSGSVPVAHLAVHFHDTYGQALSNTLAALRRGVTVVDASAGGLGGCPYAMSATGNLATEDLVWMLQGLGIRTGVDLVRLSATSVWMAEQLGRPSPSRTVRALTHQEQ
jgi:hydroxymethylglutaryl-CoA lyase